MTPFGHQTPVRNKAGDIIGGWPGKVSRITGEEQEFDRFEDAIVALGATRCGQVGRQWGQPVHSLHSLRLAERRRGGLAGLRSLRFALDWRWIGQAEGDTTLLFELNPRSRALSKLTSRHAQHQTSLVLLEHVLSDDTM